MKRIIVVAVAMLLPMMIWAQAQIDTKKMKISDFTQKITKVVLTGNHFHDACLESDVTAKWHASPFEFCTMKEFEQLKSDNSYYFLLTTKGQFKNEAEPGLMFLSLVKGGKEADKGIGHMLEVVAFPFSSAENPSGREVVFLPFILDIIQNYALSSMERDINAYMGLTNYSMNISKTADMDLVFSESDLSSEITSELRSQCFTNGVTVLDEAEADNYMSPERTNTLVSYVVAPTTVKPGAYCYKMLVDPQTSALYYFRKHKISKKYGPGFLAEDIKRITAPRNKK